MLVLVGAMVAPVAMGGAVPISKLLAVMVDLVVTRGLLASGVVVVPAVMARLGSAAVMARVRAVMASRVNPVVRQAMVGLVGREERWPEMGVTAGPAGLVVTAAMVVTGSPVRPVRRLVLAVALAVMVAVGVVVVPAVMGVMPGWRWVWVLLVSTVLAAAVVWVVMLVMAVMAVRGFRAVWRIPMAVGGVRAVMPV